MSEEDESFGSCAECDFPLGIRPKHSDCQEDNCGCLDCRGWWWDFDPRTDYPYCSIHTRDTTPSEVASIMSGEP